MTDSRPRIHIWPVEGRWGWQKGIGPHGTRPNIADTPGGAFTAALNAIGHQPAVIIYGEIPSAPF